MPQLLIEFFSEEIPARMQKRAEEDLARLVAQKLEGAGLKPQAVSTFSSPRHLGAIVENLPARAADVNEERKGPRVGAPDAAIAGFVRAAGLASINEAHVVADAKGDFYVARIARKGRAAPEILQEIVPEIVRAFPWPKSMRSGASDLTWVRPLHNILCLFDGAHVPIAIDGVASEPVTWGHRFHAPGALRPRDAGEHYAMLREARVLIDREERKAIILAEARRVCAERKLELVEDAGLLDEVTGLVEWPVVLMGRMDEAFLDLPAEVIRLSMRTHQKYFAVRDPHDGKLAPHFIVVANIEAKDGGDAIAAGNARVLSARLNDARFFWDADRKTPLYTPAREAKLKQIVFHAKLGSVWDKVERVRALARELCAVTHADPALVDRAALLCKMDLVTETVGEFPELQGQIGRALAEQNAPSPLEGEGREGGRSEQSASSTLAPSSARPPPPTPAPQGGGGREHPSVCAAIEDQYRPLGPLDRVPADPVAITLALADKLDTLVGFWAIDEKPTGSSDPYALRRAALGLVRIVLENRIRFTDRARQSAPSPLAGEGREGGASSALSDVGANTPTPNPAPQGGGEGASLSALIDFAAVGHYARFLYPDNDGAPLSDRAATLRRKYSSADEFFGQTEYYRRARHAEWWLPVAQMGSNLLAFLADRLKVQLREQGKRHDLVDAVFALGDDDLVRIVARVEALDAFLRTEDGANLLAGYRRAANILAAEEKKGKGLTPQDIARGLDPSLFEERAEMALHAALENAAPEAVSAVNAENFGAAMKALAALRAPLDCFFDEVLVNTEKPLIRANRLLLLSAIRDALHAVADFSKIEG